MIPRLIYYHKYSFGDFEFMFYRLHNNVEVVSVSPKGCDSGYGYIFKKGQVHWHNRSHLPEDLKQHISKILQNDWQEVKARWGLK